MQKSPLVCFLSGALALGAIGVFVLVILCEKRVRQHEALATRVTMAQQNTILLNQLAIDALEYSKRNPAIVPILRDANINVGGAKK